MKEQTRNTEVQINEEQIGKKEFRIMIVKMIKNLESKMEKMQESINKDLEELKNKHAETTQLLKLKILQKESTADYLNQKNESVRTSKEQNKVKRMKRAEDSLRDFWSNIRCTNIEIIGVPEEKEKKKGYEKIFEEIIVGNFPNMGKEIVNQVQEEQRVPYRINPKRNMPRHILIKLTKTKHKERILKQQRRSNK